MSYEHGATYAGAIVKSVSVENMLNQRAAVIERIEAALALLREGKKIADAANIGFPRFMLDEHKYNYRLTILEEEKTGERARELGKIVDAAAWQYLMSESGLRTLMDAKARAKWNEGIDKGQFPEFTLENVEATFAELHATRGDMFERGVLECFKRLSWDYKTNTPFKFGKRVVMRFIRGHVSGKEGGTSLGYVNYQHCNELDDLARVFHVLDGKAEPDHRQGWYSLLNRYEKTSDPPAENDYMSVRCFRNGNAHLTFKRPDLVDKMNAILAKHYPGALPHDKHAA